MVRYWTVCNHGTICTRFFDARAYSRVIDHFLVLIFWESRMDTNIERDVMEYDVFGRGRW